MIGDLRLLSFYKFKVADAANPEDCSHLFHLREGLSSICGYVYLLAGNDNEPMNGIHLKMSSLGAVDCVVQALL